MRDEIANGLKYRSIFITFSMQYLTINSKGREEILMHPQTKNLSPDE